MQPSPAQMLMIAALILVLSAVALVQFFFSYCHSILAAYAAVELSHRVRQIMDENAAQIQDNEFRRLLGLVNIAHPSAEDKWEVRTIRLYYSVVRAVEFTVARLAPAAHSWSEREFQRCCYFAAVALDRRIAVIATS